MSLSLDDLSGVGFVGTRGHAHHRYGTETLEKNTGFWFMLVTIHARVCRFWAAVPGALKNHLNTEELVRITIASLTAGGGLFGLVQALTLQVGTIFPASSDAALATVVLTMILEAHRRLGQGRDLVPQPQPSQEGRSGPSGVN